MSPRIASRSTPLFQCLCLLALLSAACTKPKLQSLAITPGAPTLPKGMEVRLAAIGTYDDGSTADLTSSVTWSSSAPQNAPVAVEAGRLGLVKGLLPGSARISATSGLISSETTVTVTGAALTALQLEPPVAAMPAGYRKGFTVAGTFSDGTTADLTAVATFTSSAPTVAEVVGGEAGPGVKGLTAGGATLTAEVMGKSATAQVEVTAALLNALDVTPKGARIAKGTAQRFVATGTFSDGTTWDLTSQVTWGGSGVTFSPGSYGLATGTAAGDASVSASFGGKSAGATLTVTSAALRTVTVTPGVGAVAKGTTQQFVATGTFSDNTTQDLSATATWTSESLPQATVSAAGLATAVAEGRAVIRASQGSGDAAVSGSATLVVSGAALSSLAVTPATAILAKGTTQQFKVTGTFSDGTTQDLTSQASWSGAGLSFSPTRSGLATSTATGETGASAAFGGQSAQAAVTVTAAALSSIAVTPGAGRVAKGTTQQLVATGTFSDGTTQDLSATATWSSESLSQATVSAAGLATAVAPGSAVLRATQGAVSGSATLVVTDATLSSLAITPSPATLAKGVTQQFTATGTFSDGTTQDLTRRVTWSSQDAAVGAITALGVTTAAGTGATQLGASFGGQSAAVSLTVGAAVPRTLALSPEGGPLVVGGTRQLTATATLTDGTTSDVSATATWSSSAASVATVSAAGLVSGAGVGTVTISAVAGNASSAVTFIVLPSPPASIAVTPGTRTLVEAAAQTFTATATYDDGSTRNISALVVWSSSNEAVATVSNAAADRGKVTAVAPGTATLTAAYGPVTGTATVTVTGLPKKMWLTTTAFKGDLGGIAGADAKCQAERPMGVNSAKALLSDGSNRVACTTANCSGGAAENKDWVLKANRPYTRADGTALFTTNAAGVFAFPMTNPLLTMAATYWTGMNRDFTASSTCQGWSSQSGMQFGANGQGNFAFDIFLQLGSLNCGGSQPLVCIEQ